MSWPATIDECLLAAERLQGRSVMLLYYARKWIGEVEAAVRKGQ